MTISCPVLLAWRISPDSATSLISVSSLNPMSGNSGPSSVSVARPLMIWRLRIDHGLDSSAAACAGVAAAPAFSSSAARSDRNAWPILKSISVMVTASSSLRRNRPLAVKSISALPTHRNGCCLANAAAVWMSHICTLWGLSPEASALAPSWTSCLAMANFIDVSGTLFPKPLMKNSPSVRLKLPITHGIPGFADPPEFAVEAFPPAPNVSSNFGVSERDGEVMTSASILFCAT